MTPREQAAARVARLFDDEGAAVLAEGGDHPTWEMALASLPDALFEVGEKPPVQLLTLARDLWSRQGDLRMATAVTRGLIRVLVDRVGHDHPDTLAQLGALGALALRAGRNDEGAEMLQQAYQGLRSTVGGRDMRLAVVAGNLGLHQARTGDFESAEHCLAVALKIRRAEAPETVARVAGQLGEVQLRLGRIDEGLDTLEVAWLADLDTVGEHHPDTLRRQLQLAQALSRAGKHRKAVPLWRGLDAVVRASGHGERMAEIGFELGRALLHVHKREEGIRRMREALKWTRQASEGGAPHPELASRLTTWAELEIQNGRPHDAEGLLREAVEVESRVSGEASANTARRCASLGTLLARMGQTDEAMGYLANAASLLVGTEGADDPSAIAAVEATLGLVATKVEELIAQRDKDGAAVMINQAITTYGPAVGFDHRGLGVLRTLASNHRIKLG
ncbi:MAG: tetratricopeptide repeat protein [Alphaproteobacteria bacterium]|nr:tetratricopeptide repeat protein [Alphaproteobacteria bacterium]